MVWSLFVDGRIYMADGAGSWVQAVAMQDGRIAAAGDQRTPRSWAASMAASVERRC